MNMSGQSSAVSGASLRQEAFFMSVVINRVVSAAALLLVLSAFALAVAEENAGSPQRPLLDLNTATAAQLESLPGIGKTRAEMILRIRRRNGPFRRLEELRSLPRLTSKQFEKLRLYLTVVKSEEPKSRSRSR